MRRLREWLIETISNEVVPYAKLKYAFLVISSLVGGWMFAVSGSWLAAFQWDFWVYVGCWVLVKPSEWIGEGIIRTFVSFLPL